MSREPNWKANALQAKPSYRQAHILHLVLRPMGGGGVSKEGGRAVGSTGVPRTESKAGRFRVFSTTIFLKRAGLLGPGRAGSALEG